MPGRRSRRGGNGGDDRSGLSWSSHPPARCRSDVSGICLPAQRLQVSFDRSGAPLSQPRCESNAPRSRAFGTTPENRCWTSPPRITAKLGIDVMPYRTAVARRLVNVHLDDAGAVTEFRGHLIDDRGHPAARAAPRGPEVNEDRNLRLENFPANVLSVRFKADMVISFFVLVVNSSHAIVLPRAAPSVSRWSRSGAPLGPCPAWGPSPSRKSVAPRALQEGIR